MKHYDFIFFNDLVHVIEYVKNEGKYIVDIKHTNILKEDNKYSWFQAPLMFGYLPLEYVENSMTFHSTFTDW